MLIRGSRQRRLSAEMSYGRRAWRGRALGMLHWRRPEWPVVGSDCAGVCPWWAQGRAGSAHNLHLPALLWSGFPVGLLLRTQEAHAGAVPRFQMPGLCWICSQVFLIAQGCRTCLALPAVTCLYVFNKRTRMKSPLFLLIFRA